MWKVRRSSAPWRRWGPRRQSGVQEAALACRRGAHVGGALARKGVQARGPRRRETEGWRVDVEERGLVGAAPARSRDGTRRPRWLRMYQTACSEKGRRAGRAPTLRWGSASGPHCRGGGAAHGEMTTLVQRGRRVASWVAERGKPTLAHVQGAHQPHPAH
jgi:hypothetical protein